MDSVHSLTYPANSHEVSPWVKVGAVLLLLTLLLPLLLLVRTAWGSAGLAYELTPAELLLHYPPATVRVPRGEILQAYTLEPSGGRRLRGTGLPSLQEGLYRFTETGRITMYSTSTELLTVIETAERKWGISPAQPHGFLQALTAGETGRFEPVAGNGALTLLAITLPVALLMIGLALLTAYLFGAARQIVYALEEDRLVIAVRTFRWVVPYDRITGVSQVEWKGFPWRTFGASFPGLHWGDFAWKGRRLKMAATQLRPLVLVEAGRLTYGITPQEPERFMTQLQARLPEAGRQ